MLRKAVKSYDDVDSFGSSEEHYEPKMLPLRFEANNERVLEHERKRDARKRYTIYRSVENWLILWYVDMYVPDCERG